jgi:cell wall-associated NlpC family hydrolase
VAGEEAQSVGVEVAPGKDVQLVEAAKRVAKLAANSKYTTGGKSHAELDCSGYVWLVFREVFPEFAYLSSEYLAKSEMFDKVATSQPADIIYFPPSQVGAELKKGNTREFPGHVGIVISDTEWIGRQSGSLGRVSLADKWWWGTRSKGQVFLRYKGLKVADLGYLKGAALWRRARA